MKNGETVVIAGLIKTDNFKTLRKVPFLGDIPIVGEAFKSRYKKIEDTEILIFVTPHIVKKLKDPLIMPAPLVERDKMMDYALNRHTKEEEKEGPHAQPWRFVTDVTLPGSDVQGTEKREPVTPIPVRHAIPHAPKQPTYDYSFPVPDDVPQTVLSEELEPEDYMLTIEDITGTPVFNEMKDLTMSTDRSDREYIIQQALRRYSEG